MLFAAPTLDVESSRGLLSGGELRSVSRGGRLEAPPAGPRGTTSWAGGFLSLARRLACGPPRDGRAAGSTRLRPV